MQIRGSMFCVCVLALWPLPLFFRTLLCCKCRLKSPTSFSHLTAKAAPVSNTNSQLSSYICSGQGCKDGSRKKMGGLFVPLYSMSCPSFPDHLGALCGSVHCIMSGIE